ncbi:MAG: deoxyribodipyrimidine photolyase, partial [Cytophagales bacterium]|nr:deoxyribodipyrimidine photolyase [Cytophagales bacterium]
WVAGAFSSKKYVANQENINRYSHTTQHGTFLDCPYENLFDHGIPEVLMENKEYIFKSYLPEFQNVELDSSLPTFIYNYYNLDPLWHQQEAGNRVLLLEPSHFQSYPIGEKPMQFMLDLAKNIDCIQVFVGEFSELKNQVGEDKIFFKEHPTTQHYSGICESRDWMFPQVRGYFPSFFAFWKQCQKYLKQYHESIAV